MIAISRRLPLIESAPLIHRLEELRSPDGTFYSFYSEDRLFRFSSAEQRKEQHSTPQYGTTLYCTFSSLRTQTSTVEYSTVGTTRMRQIFTVLYSTAQRIAVQYGRAQSGTVRDIMERLISRMAHGTEE